MPAASCVDRARTPGGTRTVAAVHRLLARTRIRFAQPRPELLDISMALLLLKLGDCCRGVNSMIFSSLDSTRRGVGRPTVRLNAELLCVLRVQSLPSTKLHRLGTNDAVDGGSAEKVIQNIDANVPAGSAHRYTGADQVLQRCVAKRRECGSDVRRFSEVADTIRAEVHDHRPNDRVFHPRDADRFANAV